MHPHACIWTCVTCICIHDANIDWELWREADTLIAAWCSSLRLSTNARAADYSCSASMSRSQMVDKGHYVSLVRDDQNIDFAGLFIGTLDVLSTGSILRTCLGIQTSLCIVIQIVGHLYIDQPTQKRMLYLRIISWHANSGVGVGVNHKAILVPDTML